MMKRLLAALLLMAAPALAAPPTPLGEGSWQTLLHAHSGKPAIVHFWGVTCGPCQAELPQWGEFVRGRPDLPLVLVEADPLPMKAERVDAVLGRAGLAKVESWALLSFDERQRYQIDPDWAGELPMTLLLGRDGRAVRLTGAADFEQIRQWLAHETAGN